MDTLFNLGGQLQHEYAELKTIRQAGGTRGQRTGTLQITGSTLVTPEGPKRLKVSRISRSPLQDALARARQRTSVNVRLDDDSNYYYHLPFRNLCK